MYFVFEMYFKNTSILYLELFKLERYLAFCILVSKTDILWILHRKRFFDVFCPTLPIGHSVEASKLDLFL